MIARHKAEESASWKVHSVIKALRILELFSPSSGELTLTQMSKALDMPKSTLLNLIKTLEGEGYLCKSKNTQAYSLGYKVIELSYNMRASMMIIQYAIPFMEDIQKSTGETVYLTSHVDGRVLYLEGVYNNRRFGKYSVVGKTRPMHCTGSGKAMMSYLPEAQVKEIIAQWGLQKITPNTITDADQLMKELVLCREQGYALDREEETLGVKCVATAIRDASGEAVGAMSISGSMITLSDEWVDLCVKQLATACTLLSEHADLFPASQYKCLP